MKSNFEDNKIENPISLISETNESINKEVVKIREQRNQQKAQKVEVGVKMIGWVILIFTVLSIVILALVSGYISFTELVESAEEGGGMPAGIPLSLEYALALFVSTLISLSVVFMLATIYFWKPMKEHLEVRKNNIEANIAAAKHSQVAAENKWAEAKRERNLVREEAKEIIAESKVEADRERRRILDQTKNEQNSIIEKSREQIEKEKAQLQDDIRNEIISTSLVAAEKIIEKELDAAANEKMVNELLDALK